MSLYTYFTDAEAEGMEPEFMAKLDMARKYAGILRPGLKFIKTCGLRTPEHNAGLIGAVTDSAHLPDANGLSHAMDFDFGGDDFSLFAALGGLYQAGLKRIGIYYTMVDGKFTPHHLHVDDDTTKSQGVIWSLLEQNC